MKTPGWLPRTAIAIASGTMLAACAASAPEPVAPDLGADAWEHHKGPCDQVLTTPEHYDLDQLGRCSRLWESYRDVSDLSVDLRSLYAVAFSRLWYDARNDYERHIADAALGRLCIPRHPRGDDGRVAEQLPSGLSCGTTAGVALASNGAGVDTPRSALDAERERLDPLRATLALEPARDKRADALTRDGQRALEKGRHGSAADAFADALDRDPARLDARYGLALALAHLGEPEQARAELEALWRVDARAVTDLLRDARTEPAFATLHADLAFKHMTGYRRIAVANAAGDLGRDATQAIVERLRALDLPPATIATDREPRLRPIVFYRDGLREEAAELRIRLELDGAALEPITWDDDEDLIVVWGQPDAASATLPEAPIVHGKRDPEDRSTDDLLDKIDKAKGDVDTLRDTGDTLEDLAP